MRKEKIELLAPAGSFASMQAAIKAGADAVYFGVEQLNMRTRSAAPFTIEDIGEIASICHDAGVKAYITLNTVMYDHDMQLMQRILREVKKQKIDAVIASDFSVIETCTEMGIPLHISTQANVSNMESVKFFSRFSDMIVLARELTLTQVGAITKEIERKNITGVSGKQLKIEIFVHGALCMAVSGKCYLSLHSQNASANRGACLQNCRHPYEVKDLETGDTLVVDNEYIMSAKDLCTIHILDEVLNSGVNVLKIEGRSKDADYVHTVTRCYREAIEAIQNNKYSAEKIEGWIKDLSTVYNREFWEGYYLGRKLGEWTKHPGSSATEKKIYIGKGSRYYPAIGVGEFLVEAGSLTAGDTIMVISPSSGMTRKKLERFRVNGEDGDKATKGNLVTFEMEVKIGPSAKLYKIVDA